MDGDGWGRSGGSATYHPEFRAAQEQAKYDKLIRFAERLSDLREVMGEHMELESFERDRICAIAVRLINATWFRVGAERYARESRTYGVTTLTKRHVTARGKRVAFRFRAKHRAQVRTALVDPGNTPSVTRASYVSPAFVEQYLDGRTIEDFRPRHMRVVGARDGDLDVEEQALLSLLRSWRIRRARAAA